MKKGSLLAAAAAASMAWCALAQAQTNIAASLLGQFSVSSSGAATYRIPIEMPPGIAILQPQLELVFNSQSAAGGMVGQFWGLSGLSAITRCVKTLAQDGERRAVNLDVSDGYCLDGQRLTLVSGTYGVADSEYRTESESFARITAVGGAGNGPASFRVQTKGGLILEYGNTTESQITAPGNPTPRAWALNKTSDRSGNALVWQYEKGSSDASYYPLSVGLLPKGQTVPAYKVEWDYGATVATAKPDSRTSYIGGLAVRDTRLITSLRTYSAGALVHAYSLGYETLGVTQLSMLKTVKRCDPTGNCLAPTVMSNQGASFGWGGSPQSTWGSARAYGVAPPPPSFPEGAKLTQDWPFYPSGRHFYNNSVGNAKGYVAGNVYTDLNQDDRQDLVTKNNDGNLSRQMGAVSGLGVAQSQSGMHGIGPAGYWLGDVNGDGYLDYITKYNDGNILWQLGSASGFGAMQSQTGMTALGADGAWMADLNGDGLVDFVTKSGQSVTWHYATGKGFGPAQTAVVAMSGIPRLVDINNDGLPDLILAAGGYTYWSLNAGNGFLPAASQKHLDWWEDGILADGNSDGTPDRFFVHDQGASYTSTADWSRFWTISGYLSSAESAQVNAIDAGLGRRFEFAYSALTDGAVYAAQSGSVLPVKDLKQGPRVLSESRTSNPLGALNTMRYNYGGLKAEAGTGRGGLGFSWVKSKDQNTGIEIYTEYHQDWPYMGLPKLAETRLAGSGSGGVIRRVNTTYACKNGSGTLCAPVPSDCNLESNWAACKAVSQARVFPHATKTVDQSWELNGVAHPSITNEVQYALNPGDGQFYGEASKATVSTSDGYSKVTTNEYHPADTNQWILGRLKRASVVSVAPDAVVGTSSVPTSSTPSSTAPSTPVSNPPSAASVAWLMPIITQLLLD